MSWVWSYHPHQGRDLCCYSAIQSCLILCNPMDFSTPGFPVLHYLLEFTQVPVLRVGVAIQPSLSSPSPPAFSFSRSESFLMTQLFTSSGQSIGTSASVHFRGLIFFRIDWFDFFLSKGLWRVFSETTVQKHQFFHTQPSSNSHINPWQMKKP